MKVVVTGGSGKVGQFVLRELVSAGYQVYNLDQKRPDDWICRSFLLDLRDSGQVFDAMAEIRPDWVVHLAANPSPHGFPRHDQFMGNVGIAHSVMQVSGDLGVRRLVYMSSEQANGWSSADRCPARIPFNEDDRTTPQSGYSLSKLLGEEILASMVARYPEMTGVSLRINYVQMPDAYERMMRWAGSGEHKSPNLWAYVDARDVATATRAALEARTPGHRAYLIAAADSMCNVPTRELVARHFPETVFADGFPEFGSAVDGTRVREELGWTPAFSWRDSLAVA